MSVSNFCSISFSISYFWLRPVSNLLAAGSIHDPAIDAVVEAVSGLLLVSEAPFEFAAQGFARAKDVGFELGHGDAEFDGDFLIAQFFKMIEHKRDALGRGKLLQNCF